jgi:hypothetical protein
MSSGKTETCDDCGASIDLRFESWEQLKSGAYICDLDSAYRYIHKTFRDNLNACICCNEIAKGGVRRGPNWVCHERCVGTKAYDQLAPYLDVHRHDHVAPTGSEESEEDESYAPSHDGEDVEEASEEEDDSYDSAEPR